LGILSWFSANPLRPAIASMAAITLIGAAKPLMDTPRNDRDWYPYLAHTPDLTVTADSFSVTPVNDWRYRGGEEMTEHYTQASFRIDGIRNVWFMLEPQPGSQLAAHTLLLFEFEGDRMLGLTIEARREADEGYDPLAGTFNAYELAYIWATARDLLTRRVMMLDHQVFIYPIAIDDAQKQTLLRRLLDRSEALETHPRWYNTATSNCTNELAKAAGFHWAPAYILTGRSDEYLYRIHLIPGATFDHAHARSDVTGFVRALNDAPPEEFDRALLQELRRRQAL
jgi:hypothetical protein